MYDAVKAALLSLAPTGPKGFEGVIRDALSEVTGQSFGIFKSGPQGGLDGLSGASANAMVIGFESKRYQESSRLGLDELKAKIVDAATNYPSLDIWILAATRSVAQNDIAALEEFGTNYGIDVLVLDWRKSAVPADIAILLANAPTTIQAHFANNTALSIDLAGVRNHASFAAASLRLRSRLTAPTVGLDAARLSAAKFLHDKMADLNAARNAFDSFAALEQPGTKIIQRRQLYEKIDNWWAKDNGAPLALLGNEGIGKTWAALGWWIEKNAADPVFPLTVVIPARDVRGTDAPSLIAATLQKATRVRNDQFWEARLNRWANVTTNNPIILVIIDGLNQNWTFKDWVDFILSISTPEWRGKIAIILSCRPDHWSNRLGGLPGLPTQAQIVNVAPFTDDELDELFALHNVKREEFTAPLLELLRVPRLSQIAISSRTELQSGGDITAERLVFEDWRHRRPQAQQALNAAQFRTFIAKLGAEAKEEIDKLEVSRASLLSRLEEDSEAEQRKLKTAERAKRPEMKDLCNHFGLVLTEVSPANQAWGSYRAVELLSWLPRGPLVQVYTAWAITRAVMGGFRQMKSMVWNLRWLPESENLDDGTEISTLTNILAHC